MKNTPNRQSIIVQWK